MAAAPRSCAPGRLNRRRMVRAIRRRPGALRRRAACGCPGAGSHARPARPERASMAANLSPAPLPPPSKTATGRLRPGSAYARGFAIGSASRSTRGLRDPLSGIARARRLQGAVRRLEATRGARRRGIRTRAPSRCRPACEIVQLVRAHRCRHAFASASPRCRRAGWMHRAREWFASLFFSSARRQKARQARVPATIRHFTGTMARPGEILS